MQLITGRLGWLENLNSYDTASLAGAFVALQTLSCMVHDVLCPYAHC